MARLNTVMSRQTAHTHEHAPAYTLTAEQELRRSVMACLLWEDEFYESGQSIASRIAALVPQVDPSIVSQIAIEARSQMHLRHVPLLLVCEMARHASHRPYVRATVSAVIQRADELAECLAIYWKDKRQPLAKSLQRGLADAFPKFNAYALAKYNRDGAVKLRDVLFLSHAAPKDAEQDATWKQLIDGTLAAPDTWEVALSAGKDKRATWERLMAERKLGALALLRNLRNMQQAGVPDATIAEALKVMKAERVLPFRFLAAVRYAPQFAQELDTALLSNLAADDNPHLPGTTIMLVDVSGSMNDPLSAKSDMRRLDAAAGLAVLAREVCARVRILTFSEQLVEVPAYRGLALASAIVQSQPHLGTYLGKAISTINQTAYDRVIVITDEQSHDRVPGPNGQGYLINVASYKPGVGYGPWKHIDGWSERVIDYIRAVEAQ